MPTYQSVELIPHLVELGFAELDREIFPALAPIVLLTSQIEIELVWR